MKVKKRKRGDMKEKRKKEEKINENVYQSNEEDIEEQEAEDNVHCDAAADIHEDHNNTQVKSILVNEWSLKLGWCGVLRCVIFSKILKYIFFELVSNIKPQPDPNMILSKIKGWYYFPLTRISSYCHRRPFIGIVRRQQTVIHMVQE